MDNRGVIQLRAEDQVDGKPFTDLAHLEPECEILRYMASVLCDRLEAALPIPPRPRPLVIFHPEAGGTQQRLVINRPSQLMQRQHLTVVGFFGQKRAEAEYVPLRNKYDQDLLAEFPKNPDLLSYSTLELPNDGFGNLVLFARPEAKKHWNHSRIHAEAVDQFAPLYYESVRIYNGLIPGGLAASHLLKLNLVKYYDYNERPMWRAVRTL